MQGPILFHIYNNVVDVFVLDIVIVAVVVYIMVDLVVAANHAIAVVATYFKMFIIICHISHNDLITTCLHMIIIL